MGKPYIIRISSQKGGVGKTTVSTNLAVALAMASFRTLIVDADTTNPAVGFHLGLDRVNMGYSDVVSGKARLANATIVHTPTGLNVLPGVIRSTTHMLTVTQITEFMKTLSNTDYDFIIIDTAPGLSPVEPRQLLDEAIIITTPDMASCTSCIRLTTQFRKEKIKHNLIVNRIKNKRYEISMREIEEMYGNRVFGALPEDEIIPLSISEHIPAYLLDRRAPFSANMGEISGLYRSKGVPATAFGQTYTGLIGWLRRMLGLR
jgi:MinD-like ATPase involved in chromosome partitioning or flagellar assembly